MPILQELLLGYAQEKEEGEKVTTRIGNKEALQAVGAYVAYRSGEQEYKKNQEAAGAILKAYLAQNPGPLYDEGSGYEARIITARSASRYDVAYMADGLVLWCAKMGLLEIDHKAFSAIKERFIEGLDVAKYEVPGRETQKLNVSKREG